jgi:hypothetical protein
MILKPYGSVASFRKDSSGRTTYASVGNAAIYLAGNICQAVSEDIQNNRLYIKQNYLFLFKYSYIFRLQRASAAHHYNIFIVK